MVKKKTPIELRLLPVCKLENILKFQFMHFPFHFWGGGRGSFAGCISHNYDLDLTMTNCVVLFD